jgi:TRAP transporter TAXI family solute receptor
MINPGILKGGIVMMKRRTKSVCLALSVSLVLLLLTPFVTPSIAKKRFFSMSTATAGGTVYPVGVIIADYWTKTLPKYGITDLQIRAQTSAGSNANCEMLRNEEVEFSTMNGVVTPACHFGRKYKAMEGKPIKDYRVLFGLWPDLFTVVVRKDANIKSVKDFRGKRVAVGRARGGTESVLRSTLAVFNIDYRKRNDLKPSYIGFTQAAEALQNGMIDIAFFNVGPPAGAIQSVMAAAGDSVEFFKWPSDEVDKIVNAVPEIYRTALPANSYMHQPETIPCPANGEFIVCRTSKVDDKLAYTLTKIVFENLKDLEVSHSIFRFMSLQNTVKGTVVPYHPGSIKYFKEKGAWNK